MLNGLAPSRTWASFKAAQPGVAHYFTLVERGYALHELVFASLPSPPPPRALTSQP